MNLYVDFGNARLKWRLGDDRTAPAGSLPTSGDLSESLDRAWAPLPAPQRVITASVAGPEPTEVLRAWLARTWGCPVHVVQARAEQCGVRNLYLEPSALGADRWAALIGARSLTRAAACVADCGTAVTVDGLSAAGEFVGGVILPGLGLQRQALARGTAGVDPADGDDTSCLARRTADAVAAGTLLGVAGAIERLCREFDEALGEETVLYLTGGDGERVGARLPRPFAYVPDLVLRGLGCIAQTL